MASAAEKLQLLNNEAATGAEAVAQIGGRYVFAINGTFGGTTAQLQFLGPNGTTYIDVTGGSFTAAGSVSVDVARGTHARVTLTGGTPSAMYATLVRAPQG